MKHTASILIAAAAIVFWPSSIGSAAQPATPMHHPGADEDDDPGMRMSSRPPAARAPAVSAPETQHQAAGEKDRRSADRPPSRPRLKASYRRFSFVRIGAMDPESPSSGAAAAQAFSSVSLDVYPVSSIVRLGLSTSGGWEDGIFNAGGDYFLAQCVSLGFQIPAGKMMPFAEMLAGGGYMRRRQLGTSVPTAYWQYGVDAGTEIFIFGRSYLSLAVGYLRPVNGFLTTPPDGNADFTSVYTNTWSFKVGLGI